MKESNRVFDPTAIAITQEHMKPWEQYPSFDEMMAEQLRRAPWIGLSIVFHALVILFLMSLPRKAATEHKSAVVAVAPEPVVEQLEEDVPPEEIPPEEEREIEPKLTEVAEVPEDVTQEDVIDDQEPESSEFENLAENPVLGLQGGGGPQGSGIGRRGKPGRGGTPAAVIKVLDDSLKWLAAHQDEDGRWDADGFMKHDIDGDPCTGPGNPIHDVGVTGLAMLAFLGNDNTLRSGKYRHNLRRAVSYLKSQMDDDGLIGEANGNHYMYDHAIASIALIEATGLSRSRMLRPYSQRAINYIQRARNPYKVWRYHPRDGNNDSSITGWMVMALKSAKDFDFAVDSKAFEYARAWYDEVTDTSTGQAGYTRLGEGSAREPQFAERFPSEKTESITAVGLPTRIFLGDTPDESPILLQAADTMLKRPPTWNESDGSIDLYYWYYGTYAIFQMGGRHWKAWKAHLDSALVKTQCRKGNSKGSWDPVGAWGESGGRVYSTALSALTLQAYFRYTRLLR